MNGVLMSPPVAPCRHTVSAASEAAGRRQRDALVVQHLRAGNRLLDRCMSRQYSDETAEALAFLHVVHSALQGRDSRCVFSVGLLLRCGIRLGFGRCSLRVGRCLLRLL